MKFSVRILKIFARFGMPGLALGVFLILLSKFNWDIAEIPSSWSGPLAFVFIISITITVIIIIKEKKHYKTNALKQSLQKNNEEIQSFSWHEIQSAVDKIVKEMREDNFFPTLIFGLGRGGAVLGGLIAGKLGNCPLIVLNLEYKWKNGSRSEQLSEYVSINANLNSVLLITGEVRSGNSMRFCLEYLRKLGATNIKKATYYFLKSSTEYVDYIGVKSTNMNVRLPWMSENYGRGYTASP